MKKHLWLHLDRAIEILADCVNLLLTKHAALVDFDGKLETNDADERQHRAIEAAGVHHAELVEYE